VDALWEAIGQFVAWVLSDPMSNLMGALFLLGWLLKPFFAAINIFRRTGAGFPEEARLSVGSAIAGTWLRVIDDYGSSILWIIGWLLAPNWLTALGIYHPLTKWVVWLGSMAVYLGWKYFYSGGSVFVMIPAMLDDATGLASLLMGLHFLFGIDPLAVQAGQLIRSLQQMGP